MQWINRQLAHQIPWDQTLIRLLSYGQVTHNNRGAISLTKNEIGNDRTKHIDVKYNFVKDHVKSGIVQLQFIPTSQMTADILTKALERTKHLFHVQGMGMSSINWLPAEGEC